MTDIDEPFRLASMAPPKRRKTWPVAVVAGAVALMAIAGVVVIARSHSTSAATPAPSPTLLGRDETCGRAMPLVQRAADLLDHFNPDNPPGPTTAGPVRRDLAELQHVAFPSMQIDLDYLRQEVAEMMSGVAPDQNFRTAMYRIISVCA